MGIQQLIIINIFLLTAVAHLCKSCSWQYGGDSVGATPKCTSEACRLL